MYYNTILVFGDVFNIHGIFKKYLAFLNAVLNVLLAVSIVTVLLCAIILL